MRRLASRAVVCSAAALALAGCGTASGVLRVPSSEADAAAVISASETAADTPAAETVSVEAPGGQAFEIPTGLLTLEGVSREDLRWWLDEDAARGDAARDDAARQDAVMAQARDQADEEAEEADEYDPWEKFNEKMFELNRRLDRYVLKPVAQVYNKIMPEPFQIMIANGLDNMSFVPRLINSMLQGKWGGAGRELSRFLLNSTAGIGGLFDPAKDYWGIQKSREDFGQTLGVWGAGPGPYLILPLLAPLTVRDGVGRLVDTFIDPFRYVIPMTTLEAIEIKAGDTVNERSLNLDLFQGFEESVIDMYSAVRHGYLQRRERLIRE